MKNTNIKYLTFFLILFFSFFIQLEGKSQCNHGWVPITYTNSTTAYGIVTINGMAAEGGDTVAAFVGGECRALGTVILNMGTAYVTLLINGDIPGELITFEIWDQSECSYISVDFTANTNPGNTIGIPPDYLQIAGQSCLVPEADFSSTTNGFIVSFQNNSLNASDYIWDFGDGVGTSTEEHPNYTFPNSGTYEVCLTASDTVCGSDEYCNQIMISSQADGIIFTLPQVSGFKDSTILCDLTVENFDSVTSFQFSIGIDTSVYEFLTYTVDDICNGITGFTSNFSNNSLGIIWTAQGLDGVTLPDGSILFSFKLRLIGKECDTADIVFSDIPTPREVISNGTTVANFISINGQVSIFKTVNLTALVKDPLGETVKGVEIALKGSGAGFETTALNGEVEYHNLIAGGTFELCPSKVGDIRNGVNILDVSLLIQHILGINSFTAPFQFLAGDVFTTNNLISGGDVFQIQQLILNNIDEFPNAQSYVFYPEEYDFVDPSNPYPFDTSIVFTNLAFDTTGIFVAVKKGDVDQTADPTKLVGSSINDITLGITDHHVLQGDIVSISVMVSQGGEILGWQWTNSWNPQTLEFLEIEYINNDLMPQCGVTNFGNNENDLADGNLAFAWTSPTAEPIYVEDNSTLFTLKFKVIGEVDSCSQVEINSNVTPSFAFESNGNEVELLDMGGTIKVGLVDRDRETYGSEVDINIFPNPFQESLSIKVASSVNTIAELSFSDILSRKVKNIKVNLRQGENVFSWDGRSESGTKLPSGIYNGTLVVNGVYESFKVSLFK